MEQERSDKKIYKSPNDKKQIKQSFKSPTNENKIEDQLEKILNSSPFQSNKKIKGKSPR